MKPLRTVAAVTALVALVAVLGLAVACSDNGDAQGKSEGEAVTAVSQFFEQERAGGRLPEGVDGIIKRGVKTNSVVQLDVSGDDRARSVEERYCMTFTYVADAISHERVYVAQLIDGAWDVEAVRPDGTCEGVT
jgi:hypothetical protein